MKAGILTYLLAIWLIACTIVCVSNAFKIDALIEIKREEVGDFWEYYDFVTGRKKSGKGK